MATKIRALYQRSKGRDLFDLWLALDRLRLDPSAILNAFGPYRPDGLTASKAQENLARKLVDPLFRTDLHPLVMTWPDGYDIDIAGALVADRLLDRLDDSTPPPQQLRRQTPDSTFAARTRPTHRAKYIAGDEPGRLRGAALDTEARSQHERSGNSASLGAHGSPRRVGWRTQAVPGNPRSRRY